MKYGVITVKALTEGHIGFAYKGVNHEGGETGWRLLYDKNEDPLDTSNPDKVYVCDIKKLVKYFPELKPFISDRHCYVFEEKDGAYVCTGTSKKDAADIPVNCRLARKTRLMDGMGPASTRSVDPVDDKSFFHNKPSQWGDVADNIVHSRPSSWEDLLPEEITRPK